MKRLSFLVALAVAIPAAPKLAAADPDPAMCEDYTDAPSVYMQVGDTQQNLLRRLGLALRANKKPDGTPNPIRLVYITSPSCTNINAIYNPVDLAAGTAMSYIPATGYTVDQTPPTCALKAAHAVDIANSALFNSACPVPTNTTNRDINVIQGPTQAYVLAVPASSSQIAITFEEAYLVFGFGAVAGMVQPWVDSTQLFVRKLTTSTLLAWAANLGIDPASKFKGNQLPGSPDVQAAVAGGMPSAIGILGAEVYDGNRTTIKALAYRAKGQYAAYYPDSSSSSRDKKNVRDGHYTVWSPTEWMDLNAGDGTPANPLARYVINLITDKPVAADQVPSFDIIHDAIGPVGLIPTCAMKVNRDREGAELKLFTPAQSCTCKYESVVATSACATCDATHTCANGTTCRASFCEAN